MTCEDYEGHSERRGYGFGYQHLDWSSLWRPGKSARRSMLSSPSSGHMLAGPDGKTSIAMDVYMIDALLRESPLMPHLMCSAFVAQLFSMGCRWL